MYFKHKMEIGWFFTVYNSGSRGSNSFTDLHASKNTNAHKTKQMMKMLLHPVGAQYMLVLSRHIAKNLDP